MTKFKDFGKGNFENANAEEIKFKLYDEEFQCVPEIQGKVMLDLVSQSASDDPAISSAVIGKFFSKVLLPESFTRFEALTNSQDKIVTMETLSEITEWLIEEYSSRPTERSSDS